MGPLRSLMLVSSFTPAFGQKWPLVVNTWGGPFTAATAAAWGELTFGGTRIDAVEKGCGTCEAEQCDGSVGYGGHPDATGEVTLDAMIMDGPTHDVGGVGYIRNIRPAISVARAVLEHTGHSLIVGEGATKFALMMGFREESLNTLQSDAAHEEWEKASCQPNYYLGFVNASTSCPPYTMPSKPSTEDQHHRHVALRREAQQDSRKRGPTLSKAYSLDVHRENHDTIGMVVIDAHGDLACGTSTNGLRNKIAGRVADSPISGAGCYVDNDVGGAAATGDGDVMQRFSSTAMAVEYMAQGLSPQAACEKVVRKIARYYPSFTGGVICVNKSGEFAGAGYNWVLTFSARNSEMDQVQTVSVPPVNVQQAVDGPVPEGISGPGVVDEAL